MSKVPTSQKDEHKIGRQLELVLAHYDSSKGLKKNKSKSGGKLSKKNPYQKVASTTEVVSVAERQKLSEEYHKLRAECGLPDTSSKTK
jgi:plasmid replication initiation protein